MVGATWQTPLAKKADVLGEAAVQDQVWQETVPLLRGRPFEEHWEAFERIYGARRPEDGPPLVWRPSPERAKRANLTALRQDLGFSSYDEVWRWSVTEREDFWQKAIEALEVRFDRGPERILDRSRGAEDPVWLPGARLNIAASCFQADPEAVAIVAGREGSPELERLTYRGLEALADRFAAALHARGLQPGDGVALYMPMNVECVAAYLGTVKAGFHVVSIPDSFAAGEVATRLRLGSAKAVVTVDRFMRGGKAVPMYPKAREAMAAVPSPSFCVVVPADPDAGVPLEGDDLFWDDFLAGPGAFEAVSCDPYDTTNVLFSSGTTGDPKAIPWTHLTPIKCAMDGRFHQDIHAGDVVAWPTNIGWMMGPWLIYASLVNRGTMALYEGVPTGEGFLQFCRDAKVSMLGLVPALARAWRGSGAAHPGGLPDVRTFSSTGEASNVHDYLYLMSLADYQAPVIEYCGGTEVGGGHLTGTVLESASPATFTTAALGIDCVVRKEEGGWAGPGEMGEIFLVPPSIGLSQRLLNQDHHAVYYEGCPEGPDGQVLRRHGDEVQILPGGFWAAQGRADDTMNLGGIKVGSIELERVMDRHPAVSETAAVGVRPTNGGGERLVVFVVPAGDPDMKRLQNELQDVIKKGLNPLFRIHDLVRVEALPRTASNKVMRRELRAQYDGPDP